MGSSRDTRLATLHELWEEAEQLWNRLHKEGTYPRFVAADYAEVYAALDPLQGTLETFLEWGAGLGIITMMARMLGFEAYGIESDARLVEEARRLAQAYAPSAEFVIGDFIPSEYEWNPEVADDSFGSEVSAPPGYEDLGMDLRDFDLVYVYPWPDEQLLCRDIMRTCGGRHALFMSYGAREGVQLERLQSEEV